MGFARPVVPDDSMVERVLTSERDVVELLIAAANSWGDVRGDRYGSGGFSPDLRHATRGWRRGAAGWTVSTWSDDTGDPEDIAKIELDFDGTGHFFCGRAADTHNDQLVLFETIVAGNLASFFAAMGALYEAAGYVGLVDVGAAVTGIEGAAPYGLHVWRDTGFSGPPPRRTTRLSAHELRSEPKEVTLSLVRRLLDATRGTSYSPFAEDA